MLEGIVANLLNRFLGMYVKNFDVGQLNVGIWSGDVKLRNLELRREALDQLHLPINVVEGHLGELTLSIPWSNLRGKPVKIDIQDVFLLAAPKEDSSYDPDEERKREHAVKMEKLESAELLKERTTEGMSQEDQLKNQSFMESLATAIVDNLQVVIKNVHFRYEDAIAVPEHPFAVGCTIKELSAVSTDADWKPTFIQSISGTAYKLATLNSLAVYWDTDAELFGKGSKGDTDSDDLNMSHEELMDRLRTYIEEGEDSQHILKPVSGKAGLELDKTGGIEKPRIKARLLFDELGFVLDDHQYRDALMLVDLFHYFIRHREYKKLQPNSRPTEDPRAWFKFAGDAILSKIHERNRRWSWDYMRERRDDRIRYIELFKKQKREAPLLPDEQADLRRLEEKLAYEDLRFWRSLARNQLRKENVGVPKEPKQQSWGEWIWGSKKAEDSDAAMTEEQRKELYEVIDWDEKKAIADSVDLPKETVKFQVESSLRTGSFTLKRDPQDKAQHVLKLVFDNFKAKVLQRPDSFMVQVDLGGLRLFDRTVEGSQYPQIIRVKDATDDEDEDDHFTEAPEMPNLEAPEEEEVVNDDDTEDSDSLFHLQFEKNPLDGSADSALKVKLKSIEIIYNPLVLVEVVNFFRPPERHMQSIGALLETAGATVEEIRQQTRAGLEFALEEHKTINAMLDIHAPLVIIPESITTERSMCLIVDAGRVGVTSKLVDKESLKLIQDKQGKDYSEQDYKQLEDLMYDRFLVKLDSTQVLIGPDIESTRAQLDPNSPSRNFHIIDRINVDFVLELSIVPQSMDLTRTRLSGHLPELHASMSDMKYKNMMRLIDIAIPQFSENEGDVAHKTETVPASKEAKEHDTRARSQSFQIARKETPVVDEESEMEEGAPTIAKSKKKPVNPKQRLFEFKFTVDRLRGSLFRANQDDACNDTLLVELVAEHFQLDYYLRESDMVAEIVLKSLSVDDHIEENPAPEFKQIISSKGFDASEDKDLFNLRFVKANPTSPTFVSEYEGIEMNLDLSVSTINLIVTRKTLLTLLDFVLITFTNPNPPRQQQPRGSTAPALKEDSKEAAPGAGKIRIKSKLESIALIFNDDGTRLATLSLNTADVGVFLADETMRVQGRMGSLTLFDDMSQKGPRSTVRRLMSIEGEDFAEFRYQTFDPTHADYPGYNSEVFLRSGSIKINFIEDPYRRIVNFVVRFGKMQSIFNAARQAAANQASQMQENAPLMRFDVVVMTPILVFPRITEDDKPSDFITAHLGEIYANNKFSRLDDSKDSPSLNLINAGMRHIRLTSHFYYEEDHSEELEMIEKVDLDFSIGYLQDNQNTSMPNLQVEGSLSPVNLRISQSQCKFLLELSKTVPAAMIPDQELQEAEAVQAIPSSTLDLAQPGTPYGGTPRPSYQAPELGGEADASVQLDLSFKVETIGLELILAKNDQPVGSLEEASLSKFFLSDTNVKLRIMTDGALESELLIQSFNVRDSRAKETNRFRKIMSLVNTNVQQQFMASISMSGGENRQLIAMLTIDSPRIIFALDYLFALNSYAQTAFAMDEPATSDVASEGSGEESPSAASEVESSAAPQPSTSAGDSRSNITTSMRINVVDSQVILVANPTIANSEAIVLGSKQLLYSQQNASTLQVSKVGMFLCRMDKFQNSRLRILDDFTIEASMESRSITKGCAMTRIEVNVDPLVLRLSLRDILLAIQIVNKASEMTNTSSSAQGEAEQRKASVGSKDTGAKPTPRRRSQIQQPSAKSDTTAVVKQTPSTVVQQSAIMQKEEMSIQVDGVRVILIGDMHVLPLLDWRVNKFNVAIRDWSSEMSADTSFDTFLNVYNFSKSAWEPLVEPYQLGFHMAKELSPDVLSVEAFSHKNLEVTVTSATIALASKSLQFFSAEQDVISKPRGSDAPYRIRNYTGFDLRVWAELGPGEEGPAEILSDGQEFPWRFEDATTMRENLAPEGAAGLVGIQLDGSGFDSINKIPLIREGETIYNLKPKKDKILHRLLVEVRLGPDYIKYITFRSPLMVENNTQIPVELGIFNLDDGNLLKIEKIGPGDARPAPVGSAYMHSVIIRPDQGFGYSWSTDSLFWRDLLKRPTRTLKCNSEQGTQSPPFYFQLHTMFDKNDPILDVYPYMRIRIHSPLEIQNLLPYDFKYRIYDRNTRKDWTNFLRKGGVSPVHVVELSHLLLLSIDMQDTVFRQCEFAIINSNAQEDFRRESTISIQDDKGVELKLGLHYFSIPDSGGAFKVSVFSPYLVLNKTGLDISLQSKSMFQAARSAAGRAVKTDATSGVRRAVPYMYSYPTNDRKNRSIIRVEGSGWGKPQSFEAIGSTFEAVMPASSGRAEYHAGISIEEGAGKYKMTNVVTVAPRFILKNKLNEDLVVREPGSSAVMDLRAGDLVPLHFLRQVPGKQLCLCFPGVNNQWSSPFNIADIGTIYVKLAKANQRQRLLRIQVLMEAATIFLHISMETSHWPFSMRNESDSEFMFYQAVSFALGRWIKIHMLTISLESKRG